MRGAKSSDKNMLMFRVIRESDKQKGRDIVESYPTKELAMIRWRELVRQATPGDCIFVPRTHGFPGVRHWQTGASEKRRYSGGD